jgi:signal transduction histidine kinase
MTLRSRLAAGLVTMAIILIGPLVFAIQSLKRLQADAQALRDREVEGSLMLGRLREGLNELRRQELALLFSNDVASRNAMSLQVEHVNVLAESLSHFQLPEQARDISAAMKQVADAAPAEYEAALKNKPHDADSISANLLGPALARADSGVLIAENVLRNRTRERVGEAATNTSRAVSLSITALMLALVIAAAIAFWLTRSISAPVLDLQAGMRAVADGDLSYNLSFPADRTDEFGQLAQSFEEMQVQLGELDKLKAEFVSVASHELKTPINVIIGYLQLLDEGIYGPLTEKQKEVHKTLALQADTLLRLVKQLLDVSRFEAGGGRLDVRRISLTKLFEELERAFHVLAIQRDVSFRVNRRGDLPDEVTWDLDRVNEVLGNLLANAFKFTPQSGSVELSVEAIDDSVHIEVHDTGAGIPPDQLPHIFEKFYQADNQRAAATAGSGLGLAIAKQIVEAHGGSIQCDSTPGVGTTFSITLPVTAVRRHSTLHPVSHPREPVAEEPAPAQASLTGPS